MLRSVAAAVVAATTVIVCSTAMGSQPLPPVVNTVMHGSQEVRGPYAFYDFCRRTPRQCRPDEQPGDRVKLDAKRWAELTEVNDIVNKTIVPMNDMQHYGVEDYWEIGVRYGDCDKYALTKQLFLRERGWPMSALLMTVVRDENGDGHAILTVRTSRGDMVLDNRQARIVAWTQTPYEYIKRQSTLDPAVWLSLTPELPLDGAVAALPTHR